MPFFPNVENRTSERKDLKFLGKVNFVDETNFRRCKIKESPRKNHSGLIKTYSMKQPDLYYFEAMKMTSQA